MGKGRTIKYGTSSYKNARNLKKVSGGPKGTNQIKKGGGRRAVAGTNKGPKFRGKTTR